MGGLEGQRKPMRDYFSFTNKHTILSGPGLATNLAWIQGPERKACWISEKSSTGSRDAKC